LKKNEKTRDAYHEDDLLWGEGITVMVARVLAATEREQKEKVCVEASIHADLTQRGGPEKLKVRQQLQPRRQLMSVPMPKPK
jgi:hypothetical protein